MFDWDPPIISSNKLREVTNISIYFASFGPIPSQFDVFGLFGAFFSSSLLSTITGVLLGLLAPDLLEMVLNAFIVADSLQDFEPEGIMDIFENARSSSLASTEITDADAGWA